MAGYSILSLSDILEEKGEGFCNEAFIIERKFFRGLGIPYLFSEAKEEAVGYQSD